MADILKPELVWIEGRCYRVMDSSVDNSSFQEYDLYQDEITNNDVDAECEEDDFEVEMIDNSRFTTNFHVSKHYFGHIIGKKGIMRSRIERDTKTSIKIPKQGQNGDIVIFGSSAANVKAARRRIDMIVMSARMKERPTHFISVPMNSPEITKNFLKFKESVLQDCPDQGVEESLFIAANKLHLTLGVMCLMDNEERMFASKVLAEARDKVLLPILEGHVPLKIRMKELSYMNDDPREIDVLYALVEEEGNSKGVLQKMADGLVEYFRKAGLMTKDHGRDHVKLHVTLLNSRYRGASGNDSRTSLNADKKSRESFDGSGILRKFANYDFGVAEFNDLHLSQRHSVGADGYYQPTSIISCVK